MHVLASVSIISPLNPLTKVVNLFLSILLKAVVGCMLNAMSQHMAVFIHATSTLSFISVEYKLGKPNTICMLGGGGGILPLPGARIPCYPAHTLVSNIDYTVFLLLNTLHLPLHK